MTNQPNKKTFSFSKEEKEKIQQCLTSMGLLKTLHDGVSLKLEKEIYGAKMRVGAVAVPEGKTRTYDFDFEKGEMYVIDTPIQKAEPTTPETANVPESKPV